MGTRTIDGKTYQEVVYPDGYEVPLSLEGASITIGTSVEVSNDSGNPLPVSDAGGSLTVDDGGASITVDGPLTNTELRASTVSVNGRSYAATTNFTRPANATAYTAGDVVGTSSSAIHQLSSVGPSGGMVLVQSVELLLAIGAVPSGMGSFRLHFYSASPTAIADNAAFNLVAGDRSSYLGYVDIGTPSDFGDTCWAQADYSGRELKLASGQTSLWCQLQTIGGFTPGASSEVYELRVKTLEVGV